MEAQLEKEARLLQLQASSRYSQDSAIDTDLQDWDTEILNIDLVNNINNKQNNNNNNNNNTLFNNFDICMECVFLGCFWVK